METFGPCALPPNASRLAVWTPYELTLSTLITIRTRVGNRRGEDGDETRQGPWSVSMVWFAQRDQRSTQMRRALVG